MSAAFRRLEQSASLFDMTDDVTQRVDFAARSKGRAPEVAGLIGQIQALTFELKELERRASSDARLLEIRRRLEELRWSLAEAARLAAARAGGPGA
jgi:hypothetical protein